MRQDHTRLPTLSAVGWGMLAAVVVTAIMLPLVMAGVIPIEKPFAARFAESLFGVGTPLPAGVGLHFLYIATWSIIYLLMLRTHPFQNAFALSAGLWILQITIFYPVVGWGFLGTAVTASAGLMTLIPHTIFAIVLGLAGYFLNRYYQ